MNILVTGGIGYIGSHVVKQLSENKDLKIVVIDDLINNNFSTVNTLEKLFLKENFEFIKLNLNDFEEVEKIFKKYSFFAIFHFAAYTQVIESMKEPIKYYENNTLNTLNLVKLSLKYKVNKFIFSSTAAVYGNVHKQLIEENEVCNPINVYGKSKLLSEEIIRDSAKANKDFKFIILRYFNVAGASLDNSLGEIHEPETHLIPLVAQTALGKREKIQIYGDTYPTEDGTCIRDYIHIEDLASAHIQSLEYLKEGNDSDIFNCGYGYGFSVKQIIEMMQKVSNVRFNIEVVEKREGEPTVLVANSNKIKNKFVWSPKYNDLELICKTALNWEKKLMSISK